MDRSRQLSSTLRRLLAAVVATVGAAAPATAALDRSPEQIAADRGCYNCHGEPPRRNVRSFAQLRAAYAALAGKAGAQQAAIDRMHHGSRFTHIAVHEQLSEEEAAALVRWLFEGGR